MGRTTEDNARTVRLGIEAFNRGDVAGYTAHFADEARMIDPFFPEPLVGREAIAQTTEEVLKAFPRLQWSLVSLTADGDRVATELHVEGTHDGPLATPEGEIPATGRSVSFDLAEILEFDSDGRIIEDRAYMDPGALMAQLGLAG